MPKQFAFCGVCRLNHDQGKGHKYGVKHMQKRDQLLGKAHRKILEVQSFLRNISRLRDGDGEFSKFWCHFCEEDITERDSLLACANTIRHLACSRHLQRVKEFWTEHGGDFQKQRLYSITTEDFQKWQAACDAIVRQGSGGQVVKMNNIHWHWALCWIRKSVEDLSSPASSEHVPRSEQACEWGRLEQDQVSPEQKDVLGVSAAHTNGLASSHSARTLGAERHLAPVSQDVVTPDMLGLTSIPRPTIHGVGNVHTGAPPPWLKAGSGVSSAGLSRSQQRKLAKLRNPKRVGAAWAERRLAELAMEQQVLTSSSAHSDSTWLPKFGRVWQSGSRRDTRREFEAEEKLGEKRGSSAVSTVHSAEVRPYISKRQRQEKETDGITDASSQGTQQS